MEASASRACGRMLKRRAAGLAAALTLSMLAGCVTDDQQALVTETKRPLVMPEQLIGLTPLDLAETLGDPAATRRDRPAEIWQYRSSACVLDIFLYEEVNEEQPGIHGEEAALLAQKAANEDPLDETLATPRVVHLEARDGAAKPLPPQLCLASLRGAIT